MPSAPASNTSTQSFSFNISPVKISTRTPLYRLNILQQISTPIVVEPPKPRSSSTRSGSRASINGQNSASVMAVPITSALGISWRNISSVPFNSSFTSSTIITLNFLSSIRFVTYIVMTRYTYYYTALHLLLSSPGYGKVNSKPSPHSRLGIDTASTSSG